MANICSRTHQITVPWNTPPVLLPVDSPCDCLNLKIPSDDFAYKRIEANIEGEHGTFYGIVCKSSGLPCGYGVFLAENYIHWG
jgi:hypothetical protein